MSTSSDWDAAGLKTFFNSRYSFEDAELLAQLWNISLAEAKQAIGHKIINDIEDLLPEGVEPTPKVNEPNIDWDAKSLDAFFKSGYTYDDAERLAQLWGQPNAYAGKKLIGAKILNGQEKLIPILLKNAPGNTSIDEQQLDMFFKSNYTYDDALLLSQLWNVDIVEAKKTIGFKVLNNAEDALPDKIRRSQPVNDGGKLLDVFFDSDYTYDDASILSQLWSIDVVEAKKTIGYKVISGYEEALPDKIRRAVG